MVKPSDISLSTIQRYLKNNVNTKSETTKDRRAFETDNLVAVLTVFKDAVAKRGVPKKVFLTLEKYNIG